MGEAKRRLAAGTAVDKVMARDHIEKAVVKMRDNRDRIASCDKHFFAHRDEWDLSAPIECSKCGGVITLLEMSHYISGYKAAGGDPTDINPDWKY